MSEPLIDSRSTEGRKRPIVCPSCCGALVRARRAIAGPPCWRCFGERVERINAAASKCEVAA